MRYTLHKYYIGYRYYKLIWMKWLLITSMLEPFNAFYRYPFDFYFNNVYVKLFNYNFTTSAICTLTRRVIRRSRFKNIYKHHNNYHINAYICIYVFTWVGIYGWNTFSVVRSLKNCLKLDNQIDEIEELKSREIVFSE